MARKFFIYEEFEKEWNDFNPNLHIKPKDKIPVRSDDKAPILCHCDICNSDYETTIRNLKSNMRNNGKYKGCRVCSHRTIVEGVNDWLTQRPDLEPYIIDKELVKGIAMYPSKYKHHSIPIKVKCPDCGYIFETGIYNLAYRGINCPLCSDGFSFPNKFLRSTLIQLEDQLEDLTFEYQPSWSNGKKYDAYFTIKDQKYIVEIDGLQHQSDVDFWNSTKEYQQANDEIKTQMALSQNIEVIRIECFKSEFEYIKNNIINSKLNELFDLSCVDWTKCLNNASNSIMLEIVNYYNEHPDMISIEIGKVLHLHKSTVQKYLRRANDLGLCDYSPEKVQENLSNYMKKKYSSNKDFIVLDDGKEVGHFYSLQDCEINLPKIYPQFQFHDSLMTKALQCSGYYHGLQFKYVHLSLEEIYKDDPLIHEVCKYYDEHFFISKDELANIFSIPKRKIDIYLEAGMNMGICKFDRKEYNRISRQRASQKRKKTQTCS